MEKAPQRGEEGYGFFQHLQQQAAKSETWKEFFKRELWAYEPDWAENEVLLDALCEIMEENQ